MAFTVKFVIGGLSMFAQANGKLYVFMLTNPMHKPVFNPAGRDDQVGDKPFKKDEDCSGQFAGGSTVAPIPYCLKVSALAGGYLPASLFAPIWISTSGSRLVLPLPATPPRPREAVLAHAEFADGSKQALGFLAGQLEFAYEATGPSATIMGKKYTKDATVLFEHRAKSPGPASSKKGTRMTHAEMQFNSTPNAVKKGITLWTDEDYSLPAAKGRKSILGVNPVECTVGSGCPPDDINCGDG